MDQLTEIIRGSDVPLVMKSTHIPYNTVKEHVGWNVLWTVDKRSVGVEEWIEERLPSGLIKASPDYTKAYNTLRRDFEVQVPIEEKVTAAGNILVNAGMALIWSAVIGAVPTYFTNALAALGVGDSSTAAAASQTNLQASSNKLRKAMNATYPDQPTNAQVRFQSDFGSSDANYQWLEVATFNNTVDASGTMLNRLVPSGGLGTKTSGATWTLTMLITLS